MGKFTLITQNVDDLHERAGSQNVIHMHGELRKVRCLDTGEVFDWSQDLTLETAHPKNLHKKGRLRPHICWFGEMPYQMDEIEDAVTRAEVFVAIGTSGVVYPAAGLASWTSPGCEKYLVNKDEAANNTLFDHILLGSATELVPKLFS